MAPHLSTYSGAYDAGFGIEQESRLNEAPGTKFHEALNDPRIAANMGLEYTGGHIHDYVGSHRTIFTAPHIKTLESWPERKYWHQYLIPKRSILPVTYADDMSMAYGRQVEHVGPPPGQEHHDLFSALPAQRMDAVRLNAVIPFVNHLETPGNLSYIFDKHKVDRLGILYKGWADAGYPDDLNPR
jgi:hypothetical protein